MNSSLSDMELVELAKQNNEAAKEELYRRCKDKITFNVVKYKKLHNRDLNVFDIEDLISECSVAIMEAIQLWDLEKGASFATFSGFVIRTRILRFLEKKTKFNENEVYGEKLELIRAPLLDEIIRDLTIKVTNPRDKYIIELFLAGMWQTDIADELKITRARVNQIIKECIK